MGLQTVSQSETPWIGGASHQAYVHCQLKTRLAPVTIDDDPGGDIPVYAGQVTDDPPEDHEGHSESRGLGEARLLLLRWGPHATFWKVSRNKIRGTHSYCCEP